MSLMGTAIATEFSLGRAAAFVDEFAAWLVGFDRAALDAAQARRAVAVFAKLDRLAQAATALAAVRVDETSAFVACGARNAVAYLAREAGTSTGQAAAALTTAQRLDTLPATNEALRAGELSVQQAAVVAEAAIGTPGAEAQLLEAARTVPVMELKRQCRELELRRDRSKDACARRHAKRSFRAFAGDDGMRQYVGLLPPEMAAEVEAVWNVFTDREFRKARGDGRRERHDQYMADGLVAMARAAAATDRGDRAAKPIPARVVIRIDGQTIRRGHATADDVCEIVGLGPIDVTTAKSMFGDAVIDFVVHNGVDITTVAHGGRRASALQLTALLAREYVCGTDHCGHREHLQLDHIVEYAKARRTDVADLGWKCHQCYRPKTTRGYTDGPLQPNGKRKLIPPNPPPLGGHAS
jgi:hypothetical protein